MILLLSSFSLKSYQVVINLSALPAEQVSSNLLKVWLKALLKVYTKQFYMTELIKVTIHRVWRR